MEEGWPGEPLILEGEGEEGEEARVEVEGRRKRRWRRPRHRWPEKPWLPKGWSWREFKRRMLLEEGYVPRATIYAPYEGEVALGGAYAATACRSCGAPLRYQVEFERGMCVECLKALYGTQEAPPQA